MFSLASNARAFDVAFISLRAEKHGSTVVAKAMAAVIHPAVLNCGCILLMYDCKWTYTFTQDRDRGFHYLKKNIIQCYEILEFSIISVDIAYIFIPFLDHVMF